MGYWILIGFLVLVGWLIIDDIYSKIEKLRKEVFFLQGKLSEKTILSSQHVDLLHIDPVDDLGTQDEEGSLFVSDAVSVVDDYNEGEQHIQGEEVISTERGFFSKFIDWFSIDWPMKVGGLLFILGVGWFIVYAIQNNWISPVVRVLLSLVVSFIMIGLGCYHIQKQPLQGFYLIGLGSSVYVVSIYLALKVFAFFGANIGLALVALQYIWMIYLSYRYKNSWLSTVGLFFAMITPFLFSTGTGNLLGLFAYLAIHLVGSMSIGLVNDRNLSRLMNVVYLLLYLMIGYVMYPNLIFSWGVFGIIVSLFLLVSGVELYQGVYKKLERTSPQYATLIASGFGLFFYLSLTNIYGGVVGGLFLLIALGYGLLWYREQSSASPYVYLVGLSSLLYTIGFAYYSFSGMNLALSMILVVGYAVSVVLYVTKNIKSILVLRYLFLLPLTLLLFFSSDAISSSQGLYYSSLVVFVGIMMGLSISSYQVLKHKPLTVFFAISGVVLLYYLIGVAFDDYLRIFLLTVVSGLIVVVGHILRFDKKDYTYYSLVSCILPALYILQYAFVINLSLFYSAIHLLLVLVVGLWLSHVRSSLFGEKAESAQLWILVAISVLYVSVVYILPIARYSIVRTLMALFVYVIGTRKFLFLGKVFWKYSLFFILPLLALFGLNQGNAFVSSFSFLLLSISCLMLRYDRFFDQSNQSLSYTYYFCSLLLLGLGVFSTTNQYMEYQMSIVILIVIFSALGLGFYVAGKYNNNKEYSMIGTVLLIAVMLRLFVVELWMLSMVMRIIVCLLIGCLMLGSGFLGNQKKSGSLKDSR